MLVSFNANGTIHSVNLDNDSFVKGDYSAHDVDVVILGEENFDNYNYTAFIRFKREDGEISPPLAMSQKRIEVGSGGAGWWYNGFTYKMQGEWFTSMAGVLEATIEIKTYDENSVATNKAYGIVKITVEDSVVEDSTPAITTEQYDSLVASLRTKLTINDEKVYQFTEVTSDIYPFVINCRTHYAKDKRKRIYFGEVLNANSTIGLIGDDESVIVICADGTIARYVGSISEYITYDKLKALAILVDKLTLYSGGVFDGTRGTVNVATPTAENNATNKKYVDGFINELKEKITNIESAQNVTDIVGTRAELDTYEFIDLLQPNDKIKVLKDETKNNSATYYKYLGNKNWEYIGKDGEYYTQEEVNVIKRELQSEIISLKQLVNTLISSNASYKED